MKGKTYFFMRQCPQKDNARQNFIMIGGLADFFKVAAAIILNFCTCGFGLYFCLEAVDK